MTILLTGKNGQLGWELHRTLMTLGNIVAFDHATLDLSDHRQLKNTIRDIKPELIVNAAAYTAVDQAEKERDKAISINATAVEIMAEETKALGAALIHYSTDYVFDGTQDAPYTEESPTNPVNTYGLSKLLGEEAIQQFNIPCLVFRTSWVYSHRGNNFLLTMLKLMQDRQHLSIVNDQTGTPTWSRTIAEITTQILSKYKHKKFDIDSLNEQRGIYHLTSSGKTSWYEFSREILRLARHVNDDINKSLDIKGIPASQYPTSALRPKNSQLSIEKISQTFGVVCPHWKDALTLCMDSVPTLSDQNYQF